MQNNVMHIQPGHHLGAPPLPPHLYGAPPDAHLQQQYASAPAPAPAAPLAAQEPLDPTNALHVGIAKLQDLKDCVDDISKDAAKFFDKGNKAAGVRARKKLQALKTLAQELRVNIQRCKAELAGGAGAGGGAEHDGDVPPDHHQQYAPEGLE